MAVAATGADKSGNINKWRQQKQPLTVAKA